MPVTNIYHQSYYPDYLKRILDVTGKFRDFHTLRADRPPPPQPPAEGVLYGWQAVAGNAYATRWFNQAKTAIQLIRGAANTNPIWEIDPIVAPEPDPVDVYYSVPGTITYVNESHPPAHPAPLPLWPTPPWPTPLPPAPPPVSWAPSAEEDYSYVYGYYYILSNLGTVGVPNKLIFEYLGYFLMELIKRCYELYRFQYNEAIVKTFCLDQEVILRSIFYSK